MNAKYELTSETREFAGRTLHRIKALRDIPRHGVKAGDLGGWIENERNLSQDGDCWVGGNALVWGNARVGANARVGGNARVWGNTLVVANARVGGNALVWGNARVGGNARVWDDARVGGNARVWDDARVGGNADITHTQHYLTIGPVGSEDITVTIWRTPNGHQVNAGCWGPGTLDGLAAEVKRRQGAEWEHRDPADVGRWTAHYTHIIALGEAVAASWAATPERAGNE